MRCVDAQGGVLRKRELDGPDKKQREKGCKEEVS